MKGICVFGESWALTLLRRGHVRLARILGDSFAPRLRSLVFSNGNMLTTIREGLK